MSPFSFSRLAGRWPNKLKPGIRGKLLIIFLLVTIIPLIFLAAVTWRQFIRQGGLVKEISVSDAAEALNALAVEGVERMTTDAALRVAEFLYERDGDILLLAGLEPTEKNFRRFLESRKGRLIQRGRWELDPAGSAWVPASPSPPRAAPAVSTNSENDDLNGFRARPADEFGYDLVSYYDEITFLDLEGHEVVKVLAPDSPKVDHPLSPERRNVADRANTYVKAETYFEELKDLRPGRIYVSEVVGAYVGTNYIGLYTPGNLAAAAEKRGYEIEYRPDDQAYAGLENPNGRRFEGIIRWASPVADGQGRKIGYVTLALNHDHVMELAEHLTPLAERRTRLPSALEGNYTFIGDYKCRVISHPRHHSVVGYDPETGEPQVPWLENSTYEGWRASGLKWIDYARDYPAFFEQSRSKAPAPALTRAGLVGLDGRYLNFAPHCTGYWDLTGNGGSGSFYILWSGLYKLVATAAIPYHTGRYAPSADNGYSRRGFGFVTITTELDSFTRPARDMEEKLAAAIDGSLRASLTDLAWLTGLLILLVVLVAAWMTTFMTGRLSRLVEGISRYRAGEWQFRFHSPVKDEFGALADAFDEMADSLSAGVKHPLCLVNLDKKVIYVNEHGLAVIKRTLSEVVGADYGAISLYPPGSPYCPLTALEEGRESDIYFQEETKRYFKATASPLFDRAGGLSGYIIESLDLTEMVAQKMEMERAMNEAQMANQHKGEFLARMSHEIRTPMNAIIGLTGLARKSLDEKAGDDGGGLSEIKDHLRQIEASSQHLLGLLNDVLDISKIEAGKIELFEEAAELPRLAEAVVSIINPRCDDKGINFERVFDSFDDISFLMDSLRLRQVLINLLGNAVKFTPAQGTVRFQMRRKDRRPGETLVEFMVSDTGIGIPAAAQAGIFKPFEQAGGNIAGRFGGTGLGLAISRHIVRLLGGDITLKSVEGQGSEFSFSLWLREVENRKAAAAAKRDDRPEELAGRRILLVDDVDLNRKIVKAMLKNTGLEIDEAENGLEAVDKFKAAPENTYSLILMDVLMPQMGGYEATQAIRALSRADAGTVPVVALTAHAFTEDIDRALSSGMNAHLAKPVKREMLLDMLLRFLAPQG